MDVPPVVTYCLSVLMNPLKQIVSKHLNCRRQPQQTSSKDLTFSARITPNLYVINLMYFQPWYLENWDMYFPEGVQNEFGYFEGPSQEIMYSGKDKRMLIETRFMVFFFHEISE